MTSDSIDQKKVEEIYSKVDKLSYEFEIYARQMMLEYRIQVIKILGEDQYYNGLYDNILKEAWEHYKLKYHDEGQTDLADLATV